MELRHQRQVVRSWLWLLIASLLLAGGAAYLVSSSLPKVYEAKVTLLVGQSSSSSTPNYNDLLASQRISQTYADLATTGTILGQVIADAGLGVTPDDFEARRGRRADPTRRWSIYRPGRRSRARRTWQTPSGTS